MEIKFILLFQHTISGSLIFYYIIEIKFHVEVKGETKNHISYITTIRICKQHFHFLALKQQVLWEKIFLEIVEMLRVTTPRLFLVIEKKRWKDEFKTILSEELGCIKIHKQNLILLLVSPVTSGLILFFRFEMIWPRLFS